MKTEAEIRARLEFRWAARRDLMDAFDECGPYRTAKEIVKRPESAVIETAIVRGKRAEIDAEIARQDLRIEELRWVLSDPGPRG
jgi:hypothetical protein